MEHSMINATDENNALSLIISLRFFTAHLLIGLPLPGILVTRLVSGATQGVVWKYDVFIISSFHHFIISSFENIMFYTSSFNHLIEMWALSLKRQKPYLKSELNIALSHLHCRRRIQMSHPRLFCCSLGQICVVCSPALRVLDTHALKCYSMKHHSR